MIETRDLVKTFEGFRALDGLSLTVPRGAVYGLVGPNGAGKSTVIRHLTGIYRQDSGTVTIDGQNVYENPELKARVAYIPDDVFYYTQADITDMMRFSKSIYKTFDEARFNKLRDAFGLPEHKQIRHLSKGMQKQAAFWLAIAQRPEVLILDEPVDGLDPVMRRRVWGLLLEEVAETGATVLVSSHNLRELEDVCDHVGIVKGGKMLIERSLDELQENIVKLQLAYEGAERLPQGLEIMHRSDTGRLIQLIVRGRQEEVTERIGATKPLFMDLVPLTLEEIFIYETGGEGSENI